MLSLWFKANENDDDECHTEDGGNGYENGYKDVVEEIFILATKACRKSEFRYYFSQLVGFPEEVSDGLRRVRVNLSARTCGCKEFDYFQLPCSHAIATATYRNVNRYTLCSPACSLETLINAYVEPVYPPGDEVDWILPDNFVEFKVEPPKYVKRVGRNQTVRIPSVGETRQVHKCNRCGNMGHNRKTCRQPLRTTDGDM
ncbi:uncharacterized protein LOC111020711 [Momordica charantia]|uniref:Uncharacterized protein LOC111020711 n=1 Tax=Momordica charantia TaxID=3673 RepID=A0A6J1DGQ6_MOMCH|nr:uncharacterized protein LOC111020711 [Momordica charantia]